MLLKKNPQNSLKIRMCPRPTIITNLTREPRLRQTNARTRAPFAARPPTTTTTAASTTAAPTVAFLGAVVVVPRPGLLGLLALFLRHVVLTGGVAAGTAGSARGRGGVDYDDEGEDWWGFRRAGDGEV